MNFESCGVLPRVLNDLAAAQTELENSGAVIFEPIDCTEAGTRALRKSCSAIACVRCQMAPGFLRVASTILLGFRQPI